MPLAERVNVARRFQRAVRIDLDLSDPAAVDGFICPQSSARIVEDYGTSHRRGWPRSLHVDGTVR